MTSITSQQLSDTRTAAHPRPGPQDSRRNSDNSSSGSNSSSSTKPTAETSVSTAVANTFITPSNGDTVEVPTTAGIKRAEDRHRTTAAATTLSFAPGEGVLATAAVAHLVDLGKQAGGRNGEELGKLGDEETVLPSPESIGGSECGSPEVVDGSEGSGGGWAEHGDEE